MTRMIRVCHADGLVEFKLLIMAFATCVDFESSIPHSPVCFSDILAIIDRS